jgi:hypothetical protein
MPRHITAAARAAAESGYQVEQLLEVVQGAE